MSASHHAILFVHIGKALPAWLAPAIRQARFFNSCPIYLAADADALSSARIPTSLNVTRVDIAGLEPSDSHRRFRGATTLDKEFWDGFWTHTTERFFIVESVIRQFGLSNVVHLENDVLLYADLAHLAPKMQRIYPNAAATFISDDLCIPGLVYFADAAAAANLSAALLEAVERADEIPLPGGLRRHCDMSLLAAIRARDDGLIGDLPIVPPDYPGHLRDSTGRAPGDPARFSRHFGALGMIFDGASLGQYLGGVDPRNAAGPSFGFVNPSCVFDPRLLQPRIAMDGSGRRVPEVVTPSGAHRAANLHIHSKNPQPFLSC